MFNLSGSSSNSLSGAITRIAISNFLGKQIYVSRSRLLLAPVRDFPNSNKTRSRRKIRRDERTSERTNGGGGQILISAYYTRPLIKRARHSARTFLRSFLRGGFRERFRKKPWGRRYRHRPSAGTTITKLPVNHKRILRGARVLAGKLARAIRRDLSSQSVAFRALPGSFSRTGKSPAHSDTKAPQQESTAAFCEPVNAWLDPGAPGAPCAAQLVWLSCDTLWCELWGCGVFSSVPKWSFLWVLWLRTRQ